MQLKNKKTNEAFPVADRHKSSIWLFLTNVDEEP